MEKAITSDKEILGGTPVFAGTRVPAEFLFEFLEDGKSIDDFIRSYPTVKRKLAVEAIRQAEKSIQKITRASENSAR